MTTANELLARVRRYGPTIEDAELAFDTDPPPELDALLRVLHTGVRAALTGRRWWGSTDSKPRVVELSLSAPLPTDVTLLAVEGDEIWDRIRADARIDLPKLFATSETARPTRKVARAG